MQATSARPSRRRRRKAKEMLLTSIQRYAAAHTAESTTSTVDIPSDEMKGRIIGREGRNIRAFEKATGVDVIIDDTPGVVIVSAFDPVRREIARISLNKLIADGRIHPSRIEELVAETQKEIEAHIQQLRRGGRAGSRRSAACNERVVNLLGRLHYRTSYSQNVLRHSIEVAFLAGMMAEEMGMDGELARRAGLLHDIGKAADHDTEGGHPQDRRRPAQALRRKRRSRPRRPRPPRRHSPRHALHGARGRGRRLQRLAARRPPRNAGPLHQADAGAGNDRHRLPRRRAGVRHPGRPRGARDRQHPTTRPTNRPPKSAATSPRRSKQQLTYPGEIKVTVIRETPLHRNGEVMTAVELTGYRWLGSTD